MSGGGYDSSTSVAESDTSYSASEAASIQSLHDERTGPAPELWAVEEPLVIPEGRKRVTTFLRGQHAGIQLTEYPEGALDHLLETAPAVITVAVAELPDQPDTPLGTRAPEGGPRPSLTGMEHLRLYLCGTGSDTASGKHELFVVIINVGCRKTTRKSGSRSAQKGCGPAGGKIPTRVPEAANGRRSVHRRKSL
jgi:hypothetical protein